MTAIRFPIMPSSESELKTVKKIAATYGFSLVHSIPTEAYLLYSPGKLALCNVSEKPFYVDFNAKSLQYRTSQGGKFKEPLAKAVGVSGAGASLTVLDATAGVGRDAYLLASLGCQVTMLERSPVLAALLEDALERLSEDVSLTLIYQDACDFMKTCDAPDVVYLDPMFPEKKKSALVKKDMQLLQRMVGYSEDETKLISLALEVAKSRVVVKRPQWAAPLDNRKPHWQIKGKRYRFDVYACLE